jgi:hypothetical protein
MPMTLSLSPDDSEVLRKIVAERCTPDDCKEALRRVPGAPSWNRIALASVDMDVLSQQLLQKLRLEQAYLPTSLLLRIMEQAWQQEDVRFGISEKLPSLVRPPRGVATWVKTLTEALTATQDKLSPWPPGTPAGALFGRLCKERDELEKVVGALKLFAALKSIHDALHSLQVEGAKWLDALAKRDGDATVATLILALSRVIKTTTAPPDKLPSDIGESCARCGKTSMDADRLLRGGKADEIAFACAKLRQMLMREPPLIDVAMFSVSREFPLVGFCTLFEDAPVREAAFDLGDTLRRRLMEHALWQAADQGLYEIEQVLAHPPDNLLGELVDRVPWTTLYLEALFDRATSDRAIGGLNTAIRSHVLSTDGPLPAGAAPASLEAVRAAFAELLGAARSAFLDADRALKDDFSQLLALQQPLTVILDRVRPGCEFFK